ncbi:MAG: LamG-like jellyroll fold domain-containing protein [Bdellovibrionota bacterium]
MSSTQITLAVLVALAVSACGSAPAGDSGSGGGSGATGAASTLAAVTISTPASSPLLSNSSSFGISGSCADSSTVILAGDDAQSTTCVGSGFSFTVSKSADATYNFNLSQTLGTATSSSVAVQWVRDTTPPTTTLNTVPSDPTAGTSASASFSSNDAGGTFECNLDAAGFSACTSPHTMSGLANGSHTLQVRSIDSLGNIEASPASTTWTQEFYDTVGLYHFDTASGATADSSLYTSTLNSALTATGTSAGGSVKFGQSESFASASSTYMSAADNAAQAFVSSTMTLEAFANFASLPANGAKFTLISKMGTAGQYGWEFGILRSGTKYYLYFSGSQNGSTAPTVVQSSQLTIATGAFHHLAVTWNKGSVAFYEDGVATGTGLIGVAGSASLFHSNASLMLGRTSTGNYLNGILDEVRISGIVRWSAGFTVPAAAYSAD